MAKHAAPAPSSPTTEANYLSGRRALLAMMTPAGRESCRQKFAGTRWPLTPADLPAAL